MKLNLPTFLTLFRVVLIPFFIFSFYIPFEWTNLVTTAIFFIASITDWFDGYLARRWKQTTRFGAFLDPVADKVIVAAALVLVAEYYHTWWITLPTIVIISREIIVSALREWMAEVGSRTKVAVSWIGKIKTTAQMFALGGLLWRYDQVMEIAAIVLLYVAVILTLWSMVQYLKAAKGSLLEE